MCTQEDNGYDEEELDKKQATEQPTQEDLDGIAGFSEVDSGSSVHNSESDYSDSVDDRDTLRLASLWIYG